MYTRTLNFNMITLVVVMVHPNTDVVGPDDQIDQADKTWELHAWIGLGKMS